MTASPPRQAQPVQRAELALLLLVGLVLQGCSADGPQALQDRARALELAFPEHAVRVLGTAGEPAPPRSPEGYRLARAERSGPAALFAAGPAGHPVELRTPDGFLL